MNLTRRDFTRDCLAGAASTKLRAAAPGRPNIILFYVDDPRATALRLCHPDGIQTPNLARLSRAGVTFTNAFTRHPLCMPARASLWTGQQDDHACMADLLHHAGYRLAIFGKNHCFTEGHLFRWFAAGFSLNSPRWNQALTPAVAEQVRAQSSNVVAA